MPIHHLACIRTTCRTSVHYHNLDDSITLGRGRLQLRDVVVNTSPECFTLLNLRALTGMRVWHSAVSNEGEVYFTREIRVVKGNTGI